MPDLRISDAADPVTLQTTDRFPIARVGNTTAYAGSLEEVAVFINSTIYRGVWSPGANSPDISHGDTLDGANWLAVTANPTTPETAPSTIPGLGNVVIRNGDRIIWASALGVWQRLPGGTLADPLTVQYSTMGGSNVAPFGFNIYDSNGVWNSIEAGPVAVLLLQQSGGSAGYLQTWQGTASGPNVAPTMNATMEVGPDGTVVAIGTLKTVSGRAVSIGNGNFPAVGCYDTASGAQGGGMWCVASSKALIFGSMDSGGAPLTQGMALDLTGGYLSIQGPLAYKPGGGPWTAPSDARIKRDVEPYTSGLAEVIALEPVSYCYSGTMDDGQRYIGLTAQQAQQAMPELVTTLPDGLLGVDAGPLLLAVVNAVRELSERVAALER